MRMMKVRPVFAWYDFWIGAYYNRAKRRIYVLPLPCIGFYMEFPDLTEPDFMDFEDEADDACPKCDGTGFYVWCVDDMCRGVGECMHGHDICPQCRGMGYAPGAERMTG